MLPLMLLTCSVFGVGLRRAYKVPIRKARTNVFEAEYRRGAPSLFPRSLAVEALYYQQVILWKVTVQWLENKPMVYVY